MECGGSNSAKLGAKATQNRDVCVIARLELSRPVDSQLRLRRQDMTIAIRSIVTGLVALGLVATASALTADEKNLAVNGDFEKVKDGVPAEWFTTGNEGGTVTRKAVTDNPK